MVRARPSNLKAVLCRQDNQWPDQCMVYGHVRTALTLEPLRTLGNLEKGEAGGLP
jgi:hypothetical protein